MKFPPHYRRCKMRLIGVVIENRCRAVEVPVIIEPVGGNGYRVTGAEGLSVGLTADGATAA